MLGVAILAQWLIFICIAPTSTGSIGVFCWMGGEAMKTLEFGLQTAVGTLCVNVATTYIAYAWIDGLAAWVSPTKACPWRAFISLHGVNGLLTDQNVCTGISVPHDYFVLG